MQATGINLESGYGEGSALFRYPLLPWPRFRFPHSWTARRLDAGAGFAFHCGSSDAQRLMTAGWLGGRS